MKESGSATSSLNFERPLVTVDVVIFCVQQDALKLLLVPRPHNVQEPFPGRWALPGGFVDVKKDRSLLECAGRKLREKTGVASPYLEQLGSWGDCDRDPRGWTTTHAYFALIPMTARTETAPSPGSTESQWVEVDEASRKRLAFDHSKILGAAVARLRGKVEYTSLPAFLLTEPFTLPQLQRTYETVLGRPVDKSAFRKRMLDADFLEETGVTQGLSKRVATAYRIRDRDQAVVFPRTFKAGE